ncbi:MAG: DMT family transporter [Clostridiales bacterium]|nr:DMT family transporter [Clostridiales bacterium]
MQNRHRHPGSLMLLVAAIIWGSTFVAQSLGAEHLEPFTFQALRSLMGALALLPLILVMNALKQKKGQTQQAATTKEVLTGGTLCGLVLFIAINLQQFGLVETSAGKAGFITALYIVIVPIYGLFLGHQARPALWLAGLIAAVGLYLLSVTEQFTIGRGDVLLIIGAFFFSIQILLVDHYGVRVDGVKLCTVQFLVCGLLSSAAMFLFETPTLANIWKAIGPLLYAGVLSSGVAYTLQILAQRSTPPAIASLLMSLEAVFAVITGIIVLKEMPTLREVGGSLMMFIGIIVAQRASIRKDAAATP